MLYVKDLEKIKSIDSRKVAFVLRDTCRSSASGDFAVFAAAYVLMRANEDYRISVDSMDLYFKTAEEPEKRALFIRQSLGYCWESIRGLKYSFSADEFKAVLLYYNGDTSQGWNTATPDGVCQLAAKLISQRSGDTILDIGTGFGSFIRECYSEKPEASFIGVEINTESAVVAEIRAELIGGNTSILQRNIFDDLPKADVTAVFANYPFGLKSRVMGSLGEGYAKDLAERDSDFSKLSSMDWVFNYRAYECVNGPGRVICIMTSGSTWNTIDRRARRHFIEGGSVEMVIALPPRIFESIGIATTMIVFSHGNERTMMVDATEMCEKGRRMNAITPEFVEKIIAACNKESEISRLVSIDDMAEADFTLSPAAYLEENETVSKDGVELGSFVSITRGAQLQANALDDMASRTATDTQYLMLSNIQNGLIDDELPYLDDVDPRWNRYLLKDGDLIMSKNGMPLKLAVAEIKGKQRIIANGNLYIISVDKNRANPYYLKAYFESEKGTNSLKRITVGSTIPSIGVEQLKKLMIPLPPLQEQESIANEYIACVEELRLLRRKTTKVIDRMSHIFDSKEG